MSNITNEMFKYAIDADAKKIGKVLFTDGTSLRLADLVHADSAFIAFKLVFENEEDNQVKVYPLTSVAGIQIDPQLDY